jgi:MFS family permease
VLTIPCLLYAMDLTVLNLAVPQLSKDLQPSSTQLLWIVDIYGFMAAGSLVTMGTLGDRIGRRRLLLIGAAAFGATSLLAAWSTSAVAAAGNLPGQPGQLLVRVARQAFTQGLHVVFAVSAAAVLGAAVLAAIRLRHLRPAPEPDETQSDRRESHVA